MESKAICGFSTVGELRVSTPVPMLFKHQLYICFPFFNPFIENIRTQGCFKNMLSWISLYKPKIFLELRFLHSGLSLIQNGLGFRHSEYIIPSHVQIVFPNTVQLPLKAWVYRNTHFSLPSSTMVITLQRKIFSNLLGQKICICFNFYTFWKIQLLCVDKIDSQ